jgi:hypothetical protein
MECDLEPVGQTAANVVTFSTDLRCTASTYQYRCGPSTRRRPLAPSNVVEVTTPADHPPPTAPSVCQQPTSRRHLTLNWLDNPDETSFTVPDGNRCGFAQSAVLNVAANVHSWNFTGLAAARHTTRVAATRNGTSAWSTAWRKPLGATIPAAPSNMTTANVTADNPDAQLAGQFEQRNGLHRQIATDRTFTVNTQTAAPRMRLVDFTGLTPVRSTTSGSRPSTQQDLAWAEPINVRTLR